jgi:methionyl aminopeptidase
MIILKSPTEIELMRAAGRIVAQTLMELGTIIAPGITTKELDRIAEEFITRSGALPAFKGYRGFPASICTSINSQVVHGIPGLNRLENGDIVSIDIGVFYDGYYGDAAATFGVGQISCEAESLIRITRESLAKGIEQAVEGNRLSDISHAIQAHVEGNGYSVVRDYVGHGIGQSMHEDPQVPNFGVPGKGPRLKEGMVLAIEPMVNQGGYNVKTLIDSWTVVTSDGSLSAHFEHSVAITRNGPLILTQP